jgi:hypothetical protein
MSYDIRMTVDHGDGYKTRVADFNVTYNLAPMFRAAGLPESVRSLYGLSGTEAQDLLRETRARMRRKPDYFKTFNPENGWGSYDLALRLLKEMYVMTRLHPRAVIEGD